MKNPGAKRIHRAGRVALALALSLPLSVAAQTPLPSLPTQSGGANIPRNLTLQQAEQLLLQRNLPVIAAKYQIEAGRAAKLIASFRPNPVLTVGAEQLPIYSPVSGSSRASSKPVATRAAIRPIPCAMII